MLSEWVEFKCINCQGEVVKKALRYYDIASVEKINDETCKVGFEVDSAIVAFNAAESYDEVMTKLKKYEQQVSVVVNDKEEDE